jgi:gluconolactonase
VRKIALLIGLMAGACKAPAQLFVAQDFTAEGLFSRNIEGPAFDRQGRLFVVNLGTDGTIGLVHPNGQTEKFLDLPAGSIANSIQFGPQGQMYLADFAGHNVLVADPVSKQVKVHCHQAEFNQPNDLAINRAGQLFASDPNWKNGTGQLWRIDPDGRATRLAQHLGTTNGLCLSPDERFLYVAESVQRKIWRFPVTENHELGSPTLFAEFTDHGLDGLKCDRQGQLYVTRYGKGTVAIFSPAGQLQREVQLTGKKVSNLVFAPDGKTVYVTLQDRRGMEKFRVE